MSSTSLAMANYNFPIHDPNSVYMMAAILCLGHWGHHELVKNEDVLKVTSLPEHISDKNTKVLD